MTPVRFELPSKTSPTVRYFVAVALVAATTLLRQPLGPLLGNSVPFILYFPAVAIAGWFGGFGPGMVATLLSGYCARTWFFDPAGTFSIPNWPSGFRLLLFLGSGCLISFLCGQLHRRTEELEKEKMLLEKKVRDRTVDLQNALSDMEAFSYSVSHDLRSPLRTMQGYTEVLLTDHGPGLKAEARGHLQRIQDVATRLEHLIDDLLIFAKGSGAKIATEPMLLKDVVAEALRTSPQLSSVEVDYAACVHSVLAHHTLLHQAIKNLLENAAKFVAPGVKPVIRLWSELRGKDVRFWIADNGIGIAPEQQKRLFTLFERLEPRNYAGTGIGLTLVERAVSKMKGRMGLESDLGAGCRFWIELPIGV